MALANVLKTWIPGDVLTAGDLNAMNSNLINTVNNIESVNIGTLENLTFNNNTATTTLSLDNNGQGCVLEVIS